MAVSIKSVGPGAAFSVSVKITYEPVGDRPPVEQHWQRPVLMTGERRDLLTPGGLNDNVNRLPAEFRAIRLTGSMTDAVGDKHVVDERIADLAEWRAALGESHERFVQDDAERRLADAFKKHFDDQGARIAAGLNAIAHALSTTTAWDVETDTSVNPAEPPEVEAWWGSTPLQSLRKWLSSKAH
jgi:hypothetical protein